MAFSDAKKQADRLRLKNPTIYSGGDPHARRDQCWSPWCNNFVEDMRDDNRCHEPACDRKLRQEALDRGFMFRVGGVVFGSVEKLLQSPENIQPYEQTKQIIDRRTGENFKIEFCADCGKEPKAPAKDVCSKCHGLHVRADAMNRRKNRRKGHKSHTAGFNKISGLDKIKLG